MLPTSRGAGATGYRLGRLIGSGVARVRPNAAVIERPKKSPSATQSSEKGQFTATRSRPLPARQSGPVLAILGIGLDLPLVRPALRGLAGPLTAELVLAGFAVAPVIRAGDLRDPIQASSAALGLASPLLHAALAPMVGPLVVELALVSAGIALFVIARSSYLNGGQPQLIRTNLTAPRVEPRFWLAPLRKPTAVG